MRPPGLGSDEGFSGSVGQIALPCCLALFVISRRRKWIAALLALGAVVAVIVSLGRVAVIGAGLGVVAFAGLAALGGQRVGRTVGSLLADFVPSQSAVGALVVTSLRSGTFKRYESDHQPRRRRISAQGKPPGPKSPNTWKRSRLDSASGIPAL